MTNFAPGTKGSPFMGSTFTFALAGIAVRALKRTITALKNRRQVNELSRLDDRALKDIGLVRTDVEAALATPMFYDPSQHLIDVAGEKRRRPIFSTQPAEVAAPALRLNRVRCDDAAITPLNAKPLAG